MQEIVPAEKAEIWRRLDSQVLPLLREVSEGAAAPERLTYSYSEEKWAVCMEWLERRASIDVLHHLKAMEPPKDDPEHGAWQYHYDKFKERVLGFIKMRATGVIDDPELVYFVIAFLSRVKDFSDRALNFLEVKPKDNLGMADRPPETEVILAEREPSGE